MPTLDLLALARCFDVTGPLPAHARITRWMRGLIVDGTVPVGAVLPSERVLAEALGVSRMTLRQALATLRDRGEIVVTGQGGSRRAVVAGKRPTVNLSSLVGLRSQILGSQMSITTDILKVELTDRPLGALEALDVGEGLLVRVQRLRRIDGVPGVLEDSFFPADLMQGLANLDLSGSMYDLIDDHYALRPATAREEIRVAVPTAQQVSLFGLQQSGSVPLLELTRTAWTAEGVPVEHSIDLFRTDSLRLVVTGRVDA